MTTALGPNKLFEKVCSITCVLHNFTWPTTIMIDKISLLFTFSNFPILIQLFFKTHLLEVPCFFQVPFFHSLLFVPISFSAKQPQLLISPIPNLLQK